MNLSTVAAIVKGQLIGPNISINNFTIDGRHSNKNTCYIALKGDNLEGHTFINQAIMNHASSAIVSQVSTHAIPVILVEDTTQALALLASHHKQQMTLPTLALTGSCGKTSVKEMIKSILPKSAFVSPGNLNNHIGVPLSLLSLKKEHTHGIFELGANHVGEISKSVSWVSPEHTLITNIAPAHLEGFGSIDGVEKAKGEIFKALTLTGTALVNLDDDRVVKQSKCHKGKKITYSTQLKNADLMAKNIQKTNTGNYSFDLHYKNNKVSIYLAVPGNHNVSNALAASAAAISLKMSLDDVKKGLEKYTGVKGRLSIKTGLNGVKLIDDSYNANLHSVKAAIDVLSEESNTRILVLGELAEAGDSLEEHYETIGHYAKEKKIDYLYTYGEKSQIAQTKFSKDGQHFTGEEALINTLKSQLAPNVTLLVKGSRSAKMENIINQLL